MPWASRISSVISLGEHLHAWACVKNKHLDYIQFVNWVLVTSKALGLDSVGFEAPAL